MYVYQKNKEAETKRGCRNRQTDGIHCITDTQWNHRLLASEYLKSWIWFSCLGRHSVASSTLCSPSGLHCLVALSDRWFASHKEGCRGGTLLRRCHVHSRTHTAVTLLTFHPRVFLPDGPYPPGRAPSHRVLFLVFGPAGVPLMKVPTSKQTRLGRSFSSPGSFDFSKL